MKKLLLLFVILTASIPLSAQEDTFNLWPDKIPGALESSTYREEANPENTWVTDVSAPTLAYYPAPDNTAGGTAVVICPGGGYAGLAIQHEGGQVARWLNELGITAFVLKYRLPNDTIMADKSIGPLQDVQEAIRTVRRGAAKWEIDPDRIGVMGFSAGGHLASTASTHFDEEVYDTPGNVSARPDFSLLIYPVISMDTAITHQGSRDNLLGKHPSDALVRHFSNEQQVNRSTPPAFLVHSLDDKVVPVENSIRYLLALKAHSVAGELHIYEEGGHGYGLGEEKNTTAGWPEACRQWLHLNGFLR